MLKQYIIEYTDTLTQIVHTVILKAEDKTAARDLFYEQFPHVENIDRITLIRM